jgi:acetyl-CoA C-acetyltransferase
VLALWVRKRFEIMEEIVILSAVRTPIGSFQGAFQTLSAPQLGSRALSAATERAGLPPEAVEQVYMGCVLTAGIGQAPARQAALGAGFPSTTGAVTVGKVCGSGMQSIMTGANALRCGDFRVVAAGGMESMSSAPYLVPGARAGMRLGHAPLVDSLIQDGLWDPYGDTHMGNCAELCVKKFDLSREQQDAFALQSYKRSHQAAESGRSSQEIVPVEVPQRRGAPTIIDQDEEPSRVNLERISKLKPAFEKAGTITAGNASKINDGAAALILTTADHAQNIGKRPMARLVAQASVAQAPEWFTTAPVLAVRAALERAQLQVEDIDLWEVNEAFAAVALGFMRELNLSDDRVNVRGGAVALGHPIGASGARILVTLLHAMEERQVQRGCAAICIGGGESTAVIVERTL